MTRLAQARVRQGRPTLQTRSPRFSLTSSTSPKFDLRWTVRLIHAPPASAGPAHRTDQKCRERRIHHGSRAVWSSCRDFGVISRNFGHRLSLHAAANPLARRSFTKIPRKHLFDACIWFRGRLKLAISLESTFRNHAGPPAPRTGRQPIAAGEV